MTSPAGPSTAAEGVRPGGYLFVFFLGWAVLYADRTALYPLLSIIGEEFSLTGVQIGSITSSFFVTYAFMQVPAGVLADRFGHRKTLTVCYALAGIALLGIAFGGVTYGLLLVFVALHGVGAGAYFPCSFGYMLTRSAPERRAFNGAVIFTGLFVGLGFGLLLAGPLYSALKSWRLPFIILTAPTLALAVYYGFRLRDLPRQQSEAKITAVFFDKSVIFVMLANFCSLYGFWLAVSWGPSFLQAERNMNLTHSGVYTALYAAAAIPASIWVGRISDKVGRRKLCVILFPLAVAAILLMSVAHSRMWLAVSLVAFGALGKPAVEPVMVAWIGDRVSRIKPEAMGSTMGVVNCIGQLSGIAAPVLTGWIRDITGSLEGGFYLGGAIVVCGFLLCLFARE